MDLLPLVDDLTQKLLQAKLSLMYEHSRSFATDRPKIYKEVNEIRNSVGLPLIPNPFEEGTDILITE